MLPAGRYFCPLTKDEPVIQWKQYPQKDLSNVSDIFRGGREGFLESHEIFVIYPSYVLSPYDKNVRNWILNEHKKIRY